MAIELNREVVDTPPRDAASVLLLRAGGRGGLEVLMLRRHDRSDVLGGMFVFPGGKVDAHDAAPQADAPTALECHRRLGEAALSETAAMALFAAAARETREEAGVRIDLRALQPWSRWITPRTPSLMRKRFDTRFFLALLPEGELAVHDDHEAVESVWLDPRDALARYWAGSVGLAPPQIMSLAHLAHFDHPQHALEEAAGRLPYLIEPQSFEGEQGRVMVYPGDERHTVRTRVMRGPSRLFWRNGRFEPALGFDGYFLPD
ncbi:MAG: NUDIX domain-containing protein [Lautropia sp.]